MKVIEPQSKGRQKSTPISSSAKKPIDSAADSDLKDRIEMNAYFKAQARGFVPGYELEDWLAAEKEEI